MPGGPDETHAHESTNMTEQVAQNPSSKTSTTASDHPQHQDGKDDGHIGEKVDIRHHQANPGPVLHDNLKNVLQEGSKEERQMRTEQMNK
jgi:hypothetical protein